MKIFLITALSVIGAGCDSILPDDYKANEFSAPEIDARACSWFSRDIVTTRSPSKYFKDSLWTISDSTCRAIEARSLASFKGTLIDSLMLDTLTENQILVSRPALIDSLTPLIRDTMMLVVYGYPTKEPKVVYAKIGVEPGQSKNIYLYTSLGYYVTTSYNNASENVDVEILKSDTSVVSYSDVMSTESVSSCSQFINGKLILTIKSRLQYQLEEGINYFVRFTLSNPKFLTDPQTKGLLYFKVLIFSN